MSKTNRCIDSMHEKESIIFPFFMKRKQYSGNRNVDDYHAGWLRCGGVNDGGRIGHVDRPMEPMIKQSTSVLWLAAGSWQHN
jgi:hypothetical protein